MDTTTSGSGSPQRKSGLLRDQVHLIKRKDSNRYEIAPIQDQLSFEKGFFIVIRACQLLAQKNEGMLLVGITCPSGAGKSVFTEKVLNFMPNIALLSMDNYNDSSRIIDGNFDDPRLTDYDTLLKNIHNLKEGKSVQVPIFDFKSSSRTGYRTVEFPSSRIVIIEGIYALSERLRPLLDLRVSVTGGVHFDFVKRVLRDIQHTGQELEEIIRQISETVYPMYKAFIEPDLRTAHIKVINNFNPFRGFQNPTYILKSRRTLTMDQIRAVLSKEHKETMEETYDIYLLPQGEDPEACQSHLRMRNRDGKYNLMFEEWVTDGPFIISPRITFEVSVRLLGGLMALGYTIAAILKRSSHVFSEDRVSVKIDWIEQLNCHYVQVQGRDRVYVKLVAEQLGMEGSYVPHTYIEQIQQEKLVEEVMALRDDLKTKLSTDEDLVSSIPRGALSRASADRVLMRNKFKSGLSNSYLAQGDKTLTKLTVLAVNDRRFDRNIESAAVLANQVTNQSALECDRKLADLVIPEHYGDTTQPIEKYLNDLENEKTRRFSYEELKSFTSDFKKHLGDGGFGDVYEGKFFNSVKIAVKVLKENTKDVMEKQFKAEVSTMCKTFHPNLVKLYGYCFDTYTKALVYEYVKHGSLDKILFKNNPEVEWEKLYDIAIEIAKGLSYLHEHCDPKIIHYDIKPNNVLIDSKFSPKITDFGMARHSNQAEQSSYRGTSGYAAPEVGKGQQVTYKSDIYGFGMMMFEFLRRKRNSQGPGWFPGEVAERVQNDDLNRIILVCDIKENDKEKAEKLCLVALWCTQQNHVNRPDMSSVVKMLQGEIPLQKPPNPFPFYDSSPQSSMFGARPLPKFSPAFTQG